MKQQRIAEMGGVAANPHAIEQQRIMMEVQDRAAAEAAAGMNPGSPSLNYMMM